jgi:hypothetical protein
MAGTATKPEPAKATRPTRQPRRVTITVLTFPAKRTTPPAWLEAFHKR